MTNNIQHTVIIGGSSGIGLATAQKLLGPSMKVTDPDLSSVGKAACRQDSCGRTFSLTPPATSARSRLANGPRPLPPLAARTR